MLRDEIKKFLKISRWSSRAETVLRVLKQYNLPDTKRLILVWSSDYKFGRRMHQKNGGYYYLNSAKYIGIIGKDKIKYAHLFIKPY